jgi:repressor LexA
MLPTGGDFFALKVRGDSMTGAGILDGDTVVVRAAQAADHGDFVAALLDDEATVKRLHHGGRAGSWLMPANDAYSPISADGAQILGKVVAVLRKVQPGEVVGSDNDLAEPAASIRLLRQRDDQVRADLRPSAASRSSGADREVTSAASSSTRVAACHGVGGRVIGSAGQFSAVAWRSCT